MASWWGRRRGQAPTAAAPSPSPAPSCCAAARAGTPTSSWTAASPTWVSRHPVFNSFAQIRRRCRLVEVWVCRASALPPRGSRSQAAAGCRLTRAGSIIDPGNTAFSPNVQMRLCRPVRLPADAAHDQCAVRRCACRRRRPRQRGTPDLPLDSELLRKLPIVARRG